MYISQWLKLSGECELFSSQVQKRGLANWTFMDCQPYVTLKEKLKVQFVQEVKGKKWHLVIDYPLQ